jgi:hypothetical protein
MFERLARALKSFLASPLPIDDRTEAEKAEQPLDPEVEAFERELRRTKQHTHQEAAEPVVDANTGDANHTDVIDIEPVIDETPPSEGEPTDELPDKTLG